MRKIGRLAAAVAAAVAMVGVQGAEPSAAAPPVPPSGTTALGVLDPIGMAVDDVTDRVFVLGGQSGVDVRTATGGDVDVVEGVAGTEIAAGGGAAYVLSPSTSSITRIDAATLATTTWSLAGLTDLAGLALSGGRVWTTGRSTGTGTTLLGFDAATGAPAGATPTIGSHPYVLTAEGHQLVAVEVVPVSGEGGSTVRQYSTQGGGLAAGTVGTIPSRGVREIAITYDHVGLTVRADSHPAELREHWLGDLSLHQTFASGAGTASLVSDGGQTVVAWARRGVAGPVAETRVEGLWDPDASLDLDLAPGEPFDDVIDGHGLALSDGAQHLYAVLDPDSGPGAWFVVRTLAATTTSVDKPVVGKAGGASVTLTGEGLAGAEVEIDHVSTTVTASTATSVTFTMPARGPSTVQVRATNPLDIQSAPISVRVVDMGIHADVPAMVGAIAPGFGAPVPPPAAVDTLEAFLAAGTLSPGAWPVTLSQRAPYANPRGSLTRLYRAMLERQPDDAGLRFWLGRLASGASLAHTAAAFAASPEFRTRYGLLNDGAFVHRLYQNVLGRQADPDGWVHWEAELRRGVTRGKVALHFSESAEHRGRTAEWVGLVLLWDGLLGRVPTASEMGTWLPLVRDHYVPLADVAVDLMGSEEHAAHVGA